MIKDFFNKVRTSFLTGLVVILPVFLTIIILKWLIGKISLWFLEPFVGLLRPYIDSFFLIFVIKVILSIVIVILIVGIGAATRLLIVRKFFNLAEALLRKAPVISKIYSVTKELSSALFGKKKGLFRRVVLVEFPRKGMFTIGFVTCEHIDRKIVQRPLEEDLASVFVPTAPNPTTGTFILVEKKELIGIDINVEEALKLILSGGAILPYGKK